MSNRSTDVLLEDISAKFDAIIEAISPLGQMQQDIAALKDNVSDLTGQARVIKAAVVDTNSELRDHAVRLRELEAKS